MKKFRNEITTNAGERIKRFGEWEGTWESYKEYLFDKGKLSINFIRDGFSYSLRPGYVPEWKLKDFV